MAEHIENEHIENEDDAIRFVRRAKFVLGYNSTPALPFESMYAAARDQRRAIELTNGCSLALRLSKRTS